MTSRLEVLLWGLTVMASGIAVLGWRGSVPPISEPPQGPMVTPAALGTLASSSQADDLEEVVASDPFRLERRPAQVAYDPELEGAAPAPPPPAPARPTLSLAGIVGGPPWEALVDGIPGREGSALVRVGQELGDLRVRRIDSVTVVIAGADTVWTLTLKKPWQ